MQHENLEPDGSYDEAIGHIFVSEHATQTQPPPPDFKKNVIKKIEEKKKEKPKRDRRT